MKSKKGGAILSALLYGQGLLGFAALAAVLLKEPAHAAPHGDVTVALASDLR